MPTYLRENDRVPVDVYGGGRVDGMAGTCAMLSVRVMTSLTLFNPPWIDLDERNRTSDLENRATREIQYTELTIRIQS